MNIQTPVAKLKPEDFETDQELRWCPGCGDYAIIKSVKKALAEIGTPREKTVFVSGIGCAARFPYYIASYGFHTIHGRAPAVATGVKLANPELDVWVVGGDGDMLSIGGNHLMHALRRNIDLNILLFNNEIYGLTKGQYSPTSRVGTRSPSTPLGSVEQPVSAALFALGAGARFVARGIDTQQRVLPELLKRAHAHKGASFLEIIQNCLVYNDDAFAHFTAKDVAQDNQILVAHAKPLRFGKDGNKGLRLRPGALEIEVVAVGEGGVAESEILVHDETNRTLANWLAAMDAPKFPVAIGVIYCNPGPSYEAAVAAQIEAAKAKASTPDLAALLRRGHSWRVGAS